MERRENRNGMVDMVAPVAHITLPEKAGLCANATAWATTLIDWLGCRDRWQPTDRRDATCNTYE